MSQDVPPFMTVDGNPLAVRAVNRGPARRDFSRERIALVKQMHKLLYRSGLPLEQAVERSRRSMGAAARCRGRRAD
jgi:UDP-N-acetylglucosamine acyltransferase